MILHGRGCNSIFFFFFVVVVFFFLAFGCSYYPVPTRWVKQPLHICLEIKNTPLSIFTTQTSFVNIDKRWCTMCQAETFKGYPFRKATLSVLFCFPFQTGAVLKGKNLHPSRSKVFRFRVDPFSEVAFSAERQTGSHQ